MNIDPPVWRRVTVRGDCMLAGLHYVIQFAMGWEDEHLYQYHVGKKLIGPPEPSLGDRVLDEDDFNLADVAPKKGSKFRYEYDFGDSWMHEISVEKIEKGVVDHKHPACIDGALNCPPEDIGGIGRYWVLIEAMADPKHPERGEFLEWLGKPFDPDAFDIKKVNRNLKKLKYD